MSLIDPPNPDLLIQYPSLSGLSVPPGAVSLLDASPGTLLFDAGKPCTGFPFVLEGEIRVSRSSDDGRRLELYRVLPGEVCIVSTTGILGNRPLSAQGCAVVRSRLAILAPIVFEQWSNHPPFRQFVFGVLADRLGDLMAVVDAVAFHRLDERLADYLLARAQVIHTTHQALADELGTVREIITRLLNRFESAGAVKLGRERIEVIDMVALRALTTTAAKSP